MFQRIVEASKRLADVANHTPVLTSTTLDRAVGAQVFLKCENFQRVGAFKFRGAFNAISLLTADERKRGVLTYSSGNHAQAVALVSRLLGVTATIVMPANAPSTKRQATEGYGAIVVEHDPDSTTREEVAAKLQAAHGYALIKPYDDENVVAGQGTAALELLDHVADLDMLLAPCGGGGLLSGTAVAAKALQPNCRAIGIEPELADDATKSFRTGKLHTVTNPATIADGTRTPSLGKITFPLIRQYVDDMQTVTEDAIVEAVRFLFFRQKIVVEPSGALGVAALLSGAVTPAQNERVGVIISGGNVDAQTMRRILDS